MNLEEIRELKERANESIKNEKRAFEPYEVYTIICEWERAEEKLRSKDFLDKVLGDEK